MADAKTAARHPFGAPFDARFFRRLQQLKIHTRRATLGSRQGIHLSRRKGHGLEFADYRPYVPGDDFRHIDWNIYGRTERLYLKQFREEQDMNVLVILDGSASMRFPEGPTSKFSVAKNLALALGYIALTDGDAVSFAILGQKLSPRFRGPKALNQAVKFFSELRPEKNFDIVDEVRAAVANMKVPGKCFFVSDFLMEPDRCLKALDAIRARNFDLSVFQLLSPEELSLEPEHYSAFLVDSESGEELELTLSAASKKEYGKLLAEHVQQFEQYCRRANIAHLLLSSAESVEDIVLNKLPRIGLLK